MLPPEAIQEKCGRMLQTSLLYFRGLRRTSTSVVSNGKVCWSFGQAIASPLIVNEVVLSLFEVGRGRRKGVGDMLGFCSHIML